MISVCSVLWFKGHNPNYKHFVRDDISQSATLRIKILGWVYAKHYDYKIIQAKRIHLWYIIIYEMWFDVNPYRIKTIGGNNFILYFMYSCICVKMAEMIYLKWNVTSRVANFWIINIFLLKFWNVREKC